MNKRVFTTWMMDRLSKTHAGTRRLLMLWLAVALVAAGAVPARAHCPVFASKVYTLGPGKPVTQSDSFNAATLQGTFTLIVQNGDASGQRRVSSGSIVLNGVEVVHESDFNQQVGLIQKVVQIQAANTLAVTLKGGSGKGTNTPPYITVQIIRHINETDGPAITINQPQAGMSFTSSPITVSGTVTDVSGVTSLTINGVATSLNGSSFSAQVPLTQGSNTITVSATDCEGNTSNKTVGVTLGGQTPPQVFITSPANGLLTKATTVQVAGTVSNGPVSSVTVNGQPASVSGNAFNATVALVEGANPINVVATKSAGQQGTASISVTRDTIAPVININAPQAGAVLGTTPAIVTGTVTDASGVFSLTVNGTPTPVVGGAFSAQVPLNAGSNNIVVTAIDFQNGNTGTRSVQTYFDSQPPTLTINGPHDGLLTNVRSLVVTGTVTDDNAVGGVTVNDQPATVNGNIFTAAISLNEGVNNITVVATDTVGGQTTANVTATLDTIAPTITILSPSAGQRFDVPNVTVTGDVGDANGVAAVTVNGSPAPLTSDHFEVNVPLQLGDSTLVVQATDNVGNVSTASVTVNHFVRLDVSIATPAPQALFRENTITVTGTADARATAVSVNGVDAALSGGVFTASDVPLHEGGTLITATARNDAGSVGTASITVLRDTSAPTVHIDSPTESAMLNNSAVNVTGMVNDVVSGTVNGEQVTVTVNGIRATVTNRTFFVPDLLLVRGLNVITAVARDQAGNESQNQISVNVQDAAGQQHLIMVSGNSQTGVIGTMLHDSLVVQAVDAYGNPLPGRGLTFTVRRSDGLLRAGTQEGQTVNVETDANGQAGVQFQLGTRLGVGNNDVAVTAPGFNGELIFSHSSTVGQPKEISGAMVMGETARGLVGSQVPMPFQIIVTDQGGNPVAGVPILFTIEQGGGSIGGESSVTLPTDSDGRAAVFLTLGPQPGIGNNVAKATFQGLAGAPVFFTATGITPGAVTQTRVSGIVLDNAHVPIPNATAKIVGSDLSAFSDEQGQFVIPNAPVGTITLIVDGRTSTRPETFPFLAFQMLTIAGQDNTIGMPVFMPPLDTAGIKTVGGNQDVTLTMAGVPGVAFTVFAHSVTDQQGQPYVGPLSISQVHADKVPMPPPNGTAPKLVWTLQPAGLHFNKPIRVQLPNTDGLAPGQVLEIFSFDHALEQFVSGGMARVSADGSVIVSDPGFGIHVSGWGAPQPPPPPRNCVSGCDDNNSCTSDRCNNGSCQNTPVADGTSCSDGGVINGMCRSGRCVGVKLEIYDVLTPSDTANPNGEDSFVTPDNIVVRGRVTERPELDAQIRWTVAPVGGVTRAATPATATGPNITFKGASGQSTGGSRQANRPLQYDVTARVTVDGRQLEDTVPPLEPIRQDERDIIRQEYIDYATQFRPTRDKVNAPQTARFNTGNYSMIAEETAGNLQNLLNQLGPVVNALLNNDVQVRAVGTRNLQPTDVVVNPGPDIATSGSNAVNIGPLGDTDPQGDDVCTVMANGACNGAITAGPNGIAETRANNRNAGVNLSSAIESAFRNPQRNRAVGSMSVNSRHTRGRAFDLVPNAAHGISVRGKTTNQLICIIEMAGDSIVGGQDSFVEQGCCTFLRCNSPSADHNHIQN